MILVNIVWSFLGMITPFWPTYHILSNPSGNIVITKVNILSIYHAEYAFLCIRVSECSYRRNSFVKVSRMLLLGYKNTEARVLVFFHEERVGIAGQGMERSSQAQTDLSAGCVHLWPHEVFMMWYQHPLKRFSILIVSCFVIWTAYVWIQCALNSI